MRTRDKSITINSDFVQGHTIEMAVAARNESQQEQKIESSLTPKITLNITGKTSASAAPSGLVATTSFYSVFLDWDNPVDYDFDQIDVYAASSNIRTSAFKIGTVRGTVYTHNLGAANLTRYYWIKAKNTAGVESVWHPLSPTAGVEATTGAFPPADIDDFAVIASKMFQKIPVLDGDTWTDNTPGAGDITWNAHSVYYNGARYLISTDNSDKHYIYWVVGNTGGSGTVADPYLSTYSDAADAPTQTDTLFIIATNISGTHNVAWNSIANQVIGSAYITDASIINAKIALLAVDTANIVDAAITNLKVSGDLNANKITVGTLPVERTAAKCTDANADQTSLNTAADTAKVQGSTIIVGGYIGTDFLTADNIMAGTLTGRTVQTAASGQRVVISGVDNAQYFYNSDGDKSIIVDDNLFYTDAGMEFVTRATSGNSILTGELLYIGSPTSRSALKAIEILRNIEATPLTAFKVWHNGNVYAAGTLEVNGQVDFDGNVDCNSGLDVTGSITVTGTVDGTDVAGLKSDFDTHDGLTYSAHHPRVSGDLDRQSGAILYGGVSYTMVIDNYGHITSMEEIT